jgi:hypothetical protein
MRLEGAQLLGYHGRYHRAATGFLTWRLAAGKPASGSRVAPVEPDQVRAAVGGTFSLLSLYYVIQTSRRAAQQIRG